MHTVNIERESVQYVHLEVIVDGAVVTSGVEFAIVHTWERPGVGNWVAAAIVNGYTALLVNAPALGGTGRFDVYSRVTGASEAPVLPAARVNIT